MSGFNYVSSTFSPVLWNPYSAQPLGTPAAPFVKEDEDIVAAIDIAVDVAQKKADGLSVKNRHDCMRAIYATRDGILKEIAFLKEKNMVCVDMERVAQKAVAQIQALPSLFCKAGNTEKLDLLDRQIAALDFTQPGGSSEYDSGSDPVQRILRGKVSQRITHAYGRLPAIVFSIGSGSLLKEADEESTTPVRDSVVSASVDTGVSQGIGAVFRSIPAYKIIVGTQIVATGASAAEPKVKRFLETHSPAECVHYDTPEDQSECLEAYGSAILLDTALLAAQLPSKAIHKVEETITEASKKTLDAVTAGTSLVKSPIQEFLKAHSPQECVRHDALDDRERCLEVYGSALILNALLPDGP